MNWKLENGIIKLLRSDHTEYIPSASELAASTANNAFGLQGAVYPSPFEELDIRPSRFCQFPILYFEYHEDLISLHLYIDKGGEKAEVAVNEGHFLDYVVFNGLWYRLEQDVIYFNSLIDSMHLQVGNIAYVQYMTLKRTLSSTTVHYQDLVEEQVLDKKHDSAHFVSKGLQGTLFPYQDCGCNWLSFMTNNCCGSILGDEMGLGKTLQIITLFGSQKELHPDAHFLVICPVSLLENWRREIAKFYPSLSVYIHHGSNRTGDYTNFLKFDVIVTSYSNAQADLFLLNMVNWNIVVIDEAQNIKNPAAKRTKAVKNLKRSVAIAVTGTPFENHMSDIWSIVDFVLPGFLGNLSQFETHFPDTVDAAQELEQVISPIMIRRRVKEVAKDLPPRVDIPTPILMTDEEARYYETGRRKMMEDVDMMDMSLDKIQGLRMFCTHPLVYDPALDEVDPLSISNKYERFCDILEGIFEQGEKAVVFTSFNKMIDLMVHDIRRRFGVYTDFINGSIGAVNRQNIVDAFSSHVGPALLVLNPRAAGAGLNITAANHAIHYNLEWNPAIEDQASARVYRKGQDKTVFVYRLYYVDTIEEIIDQKIQNKRSISDTAIIGNLGDSVSKEELIRALSVTPYKS